MALTAMMTSGCDDTFAPIEPSDLQFSVFGYLDASADTQWIRVMPVRPLQTTSADPLGATVTLENLETGRLAELQDSVFRFVPNPDVGSEGIYIHNFWTTERIQPGATYRFSANLEGRPPSEATVKIPDKYHVEVWHALTGNRDDRLWIDGLEHVAYAEITHFYDDCGAAVDQEILATASSDSDDAMAISISDRVRPREGCGQPEVEKRQVLVVGSGAPWPSGAEYSTSALGVPDAPSNISNSLGFLGGVLTRFVPYEDCWIENVLPDPEAYCRLRYDESTATLRGTVRDLTCGGEVARATVQLREVQPDRRVSRRVRTTKSSRSGSFEIGALDGGRRYALGVRRLDAKGLHEFHEFTDTLEFAAGEQRVIEVGLRATNACLQ